MRRKYIILLILCALLLLSACTREDTPVPNAAWYSTFLEMHNSIGDTMPYFVNFEDRGYTHFIFVHSEDEFLEGEFPDDAIIAWPALYAHLMVDAMNSWILTNEKQASVVRFSLTYPLTVKDLVDNWENVATFLMLEVGGLEQANYLWPHADSESGRIRQLERDILGLAFETAGIDITQYGLSRPLGAQGFRYNMETGRSIMFELFDKLDEDVQLELLTEIPNLMASNRQQLRWIEWRAKHGF